MKNRLLMGIVSLVTLSSMFLAACSPAQPPVATTAPAAATEAPAAAVKRGGELIFARNEEPESLDPIVPGDNGSIFTITQIYDTLVRPDVTGYKIEPDLAQSWETSSDGLTYTFHLRDAKFSNGDPVTMEDVIYSLERARSKDSAGSFAFDGVDKIESVDAKTLKITLKSPQAPFLSDLAYYVASIVPKKVFEADPTGFSSKPVGSGPFMIDSFTRGEDIVLKPNPNYWEIGPDGKQLPYLTKITMRYIPENSTRVLGLQNGDFDVIQNVPYNQIATLKTAQGLTVDQSEDFGLHYLYINESKSPTDNKNFRLALNYATNRDVILKNVYFGIGEIPNTCLPRMRYWNKDVPLIPYDPAKAKDLLSQSGYKGETIDILISSGDTTRKQIATILQQNWKDVGINANIKEMDNGAMLDMTHKTTDWNVMVQSTTSDINDDDELATLKTGPKYWGAHYNNPVVTDALKAARESLDDKVRGDNYLKVQQILYNQDGYCVPFNYDPAISGLHSYVKNWKTIATGWWWLRTVWLDK
jgi:peptide/nickel transport system substrate-binding protein